MLLNSDDLEKLIYHTVDLAAPCDDNSVFFGFLAIRENPVLIEAVMDYVTKFYDALLRTLPLTSAVERIALQMQRCFTEKEYNMLFDARERDFTKPIFKTLLITNQTDRLLFTTNRSMSHEAFLSLLKVWSEVNNKVLYEFLYVDKNGSAS